MGFDFQLQAPVRRHADGVVHVTRLEYIDGLDGTAGGLHLTARRLRDIAVLDDHDEQRARFRDLVGDTEAPSIRVAPTVVASRDGG